MDRRVPTISIAYATLLLIEVALHREIKFVAEDAIMSSFAMYVFGGIGIGSMLGLLKPFRAWTTRHALLAIAVTLTVALAILAHVPGVAAICVIAITASFGMFFSKTLSEARMSTVVWSFGIGSVLLYLGINTVLGCSETVIALIAIAAIALAALALEPAKRTAPALVCALAFATAAAQGYAPVARLQRSDPMLANATPVRPPIYTPLFRTDVLAVEGAHVIVTNGARWALVTSKGTRPNKTLGLALAAGSPASMLVIGSAGGNDVMVGLELGVPKITAVDVNPTVIDLMRGELAEMSGGAYTDPRVTAIAAEGRHFLETTSDTYDLITLHGVQTGNTSDFVQPALVESFLYTREALLVMWRRLTPSGVLFFDEYERTRTIDKTQVSLLDTIELAAKSTLGLRDDQILHVRYERSALGSDIQHAREAVILCKKDIDPKVRARAGNLVKKAIDISPSRVIVTDDHPFFSDDRVSITSGWGAMVALAVSISSIVFAGFATRGKGIGLAGIVLFATGAGYITIVSAFTGPASLVLGQPELATPVIFVSASVWALAGGILALRVRRKIVIAGLVLLPIYLALLLPMLSALVPFVLPIRSLAVRVTVVALLLMPAAVLAELPYIALLNRFEGTKRGWAYVTENLGAAFGVALCIALEIAFGFRVALCGAACLYVVALAAFVRARASL